MRSLSHQQHPCVWNLGKYGLLVATSLQVDPRRASTCEGAAEQLSKSIILRPDVKLK